MSKEIENKKPADQVKPNAPTDPKKPEVSDGKGSGGAVSKQKPQQQQQPKKDAANKTNSKPEAEKPKDVANKTNSKPEVEKPKEAAVKASPPPQQVKADVKVSEQSSPVKSGNESGSRSPVKGGPQINMHQVVVQRGVSGTVGWFSQSKGFGFIDRKDKEQRIFVHSNAIIHGNNSYYGLDEGEDVEFDIVQGNKGLEAAAVTGPNGCGTGFRLRAVPIGRRRDFANRGVVNRGNRFANSRNRRNAASGNENSGSGSNSEYDSAAENAAEERKADAPKNSGDGKKVQPAQTKKQETKTNQGAQKQETKGAQKQETKATQGAQKQPIKKQA